MGRVGGVLVAGAVAVAVGVVAAGPAVAAKGGNSDTAHACQQGGHENRFEAETGNPFKNAGDCASHGAQGGESYSLQFLTTTYSCPNTGTCWGVVSGSDLIPRTLWAVLERNTGLPVSQGNIGQDGSLPTTNANLRCGRGDGQLQAQTPSGTVFINRNAPC
jgi:hypothetical protein